MLGPLELSGRPRNLLVIALDTTRRDSLGRYSGDPGHSPTLDGLMAGGLVLDDHRSCTDWTYESLICVQSGRYPYHLGGAWATPDGGWSELPEETMLVSQHLSALGFQTALVSAQSFIGDSGPISAGFDTISYRSDRPASEVVDEALLTLEVIDPTRPWYVNLHFLDPHQLYDPPLEYLEGLKALPECPYDLSTVEGYGQLLSEWNTLPEELRSLVLSHLDVRYRGEIRYFDDQLARLWGELQAGGWLEGTLVVFWTDHGEQFWQHGYPSHGGGLYDEESRSSAFFWSEDLEAPLAWGDPTTHVDLMPTALDAMGLEGLLSPDGVIVGERSEDDPRFAIHYRGSATNQSVVRADSKLIYRWTGEKQYFRINTDPGELKNLYEPADPEVIALWELLGPEVEAAYTASGDAAPVDLGP